MVGKYNPEQGDIVFVDFDPTKSHEQKDYRPCIIISNNIFNNNTKMVIVCPITSNEKDFPTHYLLSDTKKIHGSVLCEHVRSIEYEIRTLKFIEKSSDNDFTNNVNLLNACIEK